MKLRKKNGLFTGKKHLCFTRYQKTLCCLIIVLICLMAYISVSRSTGRYNIKKHAADIPSDALLIYFRAEKKTNIKWYDFACYVLNKKINYKRLNNDSVQKIASAIKNSSVKPSNGFSDFFHSTDIIFENKVFPISSAYHYSYTNDWGNDRVYKGHSRHEGIDIICSKGTPVISVCDGTVEKKGWDELGGWRIGIRGTDSVYYYYAHLSKYKEGIEKKDKVKKGEIVGYVGNTGYGPEGTSGKFIDHLHFGMYNISDKAFNPYPYLVGWENK